MLKPPRVAVNRGNLDGFLVKVLRILDEHNDRVASQPGLDDSLTVDIFDLVCDLLGVPFDRYTVDPQTGNCEMPADGYCRDWLRDIASDQKHEDRLSRFIRAARTEGCRDLVSRMAKAVATWEAYRADDEQAFLPHSFFKDMDAISKWLPHIQQPPTAT